MEEGCQGQSGQMAKRPWFINGGLNRFTKVTISGNENRNAEPSVPLHKSGSLAIKTTGSELKLMKLVAISVV
jgi:hypothetical protein